MKPVNKIVTIDGPAGVGKSTVAGKLAMRLGFLHLNSGGLYRAVALKAIERGVGLDDNLSLSRLARTISFEFVVQQNGQTVLLVDGEDISEALSAPGIADGASKVAALPEVREVLTEVQRISAQSGGVVLEGRDAGTIVFPDASFKFYLTASPEVRAGRRHQDLQALGEDVDFLSVEAALNERDLRDSTRLIAPQQQPVDAKCIDTSSKSIEEVVEMLFTKVSEGIKAVRP